MGGRLPFWAYQGRVRLELASYDAAERFCRVFDDVPVALERLSKLVRICIYSSGSIAAQKLLFRHSTHGDLTRVRSSPTT